MTISKGRDWGSPVARPATLRVAGSDAELARWVATDARHDYAVGVGDVARCTGQSARAVSDCAPDGSTASATMQRLPFDALRVTLDGRTMLAVSHVRLGRIWSAPFIVISNCGWVGEWNVAPRAHPNDGRVDVVEWGAAMPLRQRWASRRRLPNATHLPHPMIRTRQVSAEAFQFGRRVAVVVDGVRHDRAARVSIEVLADHFAVLV